MGQRMVKDSTGRLITRKSVLINAVGMNNVVADGADPSVYEISQRADVRRQESVLKSHLACRFHAWQHERTTLDSAINCCIHVFTPAITAVL